MPTYTNTLPFCPGPCIVGREASGKGGADFLSATQVHNFMQAVLADAYFVKAGLPAGQVGYFSSAAEGGGSLFSNPSKDGVINMEDLVYVGQGLFKVTGGQAETYLIKTAEYTFQEGDPPTIFGDTSAGPFPIHLPADPPDGSKFTVKNVGTNNYELDVDGNGNNIERSASNISLAQGESADFRFTSLGYFIDMADRSVSGLHTPRWWLLENYIQRAAEYEVHNLAGGSSEIKMDAGSTYVVEQGAIVII